jgi:hypothetical protein
MKKIPLIIHVDPNYQKNYVNCFCDFYQKMQVLVKSLTLKGKVVVGIHFKWQPCPSNLSTTMAPRA